MSTSAWPPIVHYRPIGWDVTLCGRHFRMFDGEPDTDKYAIGAVTPDRITCPGCRKALPENVILPEPAPRRDPELRRWAIEQAIQLARLHGYGSPAILECCADGLLAYVLQEQPS